MDSKQKQKQSQSQSQPQPLYKLQKSSLFYYPVDNNFVMNSQQQAYPHSQINPDLSILIQQQQLQLQKLLQQQLQQNINNSNISQLYNHDYYHDYYQDNIPQSYNPYYYHDANYYHDSFSQKINTGKQFETKTEIQSNTHHEKKRNNKIENNNHWKKSKINDDINKVNDNDDDNFNCRYCGKNMFETICFVACKFYFIHTIAANLKKAIYIKSCKYKDNCHRFHTRKNVEGQIIYINISGRIIDKFVCKILTFNESKCTLRVNVIGELKFDDRNYITFYINGKYERTIDIFKANWDFCSYDKNDKLNF